MLEEFYSGKAHRILRYVLPSGRSPVDDFLEGLDARDQSRMVALITSSANSGPPLRNQQKCKQVEGYKFYEFKTHGQRIFWCWGPGRTIVLFHAFTKRQDRIPPSELNTGSARYADVMADLEDERRR